MPPSFFPNPIPPFNINTSVGAFEIGTLVAATLFGATCIQTYLYFERYPKDNRLIKALVTAVWLLELCHTIAICHAVYTMTITWYGDSELLSVAPASLDVSILLSGFIGPLEQAWFIRRLYIFSKNIWLTALCCILSFARCLGSVGYAAVALQLWKVQRATILDFELQYWWILTCIVVLGAVNDVLLACSLAWYLKKRKEHVLARVARLLDRLIFWAVETSAITSFATLSMMICFFAMPTNFVYIGIYLCLAKLYANALLASLNGRAYLAHQFDQVMSLENLSDASCNLSTAMPSVPRPISSFGYRSQFSYNVEQGYRRFSV
ncbi:hypothetical protein BT96DRAFT_1020918 [Gymnopus androsaceus JB14]|uniref:DUF6534 domain-containing protein n=1 Tax=Gymnopus androsaceus JB14 TaxID=1447944 RepID=A0A6A4HJF0_9AGAR|nr:hypothetical protein BT96DRAFT_1020918 [Gymnopus androsaceus JB14]